MTSEASETKRRQEAERARVAAGAGHIVDYFHQADDPYAHLAAQILARFVQSFDVELRTHLCSAPPDWAAPERERLVAYSRRDAARLAARSGLRFADPGRQPPPERVAEAERLLAGALEEGDFLARAATIGEALWSDAPFPAGKPGDPARPVAEGDALREKLGHYLAGTFHYGGEWYWGIDRLHYLEERLAALGVRREGAPAAPIYAQPACPSPQGPAPRTKGLSVPLEFFVSFRSPYTYIVTARTKALADAYGAELKIRFVLPMVMRGLPVPPTKGRYITLDTAREARRLGVPFGRIADPVGRPVERGYSLLPWAIREGAGYAFCESFMRAVWSEGIDAGEDVGLRTIVERAGLSWETARGLLGNDDWRPEAEANRLELLELGLWGVPCFRFGDVAVWGQDRLWVIEDVMRAASSSN